MKLIILNPDSTGMTEEMIQARVDRMKSAARPGTEISMEYQKKTKICVDSALDEAVTSLELIEKAVQAQKDGYDAIGLYCAGDPAIDAIREAVSIPVVGGGQASLQLAIGLGYKFSWITSSKNKAPSDKLIRCSGIDYSRLASIRNVVVDIATAKDLNRQRMVDCLVECGTKCMQDGAHVLILGCLVFAGMGKEVSKQLGIPVVDPAFSIVAMAELLCAAGLSQSKQTYPAPEQQKRSWTGGELFF